MRFELSVPATLHAPPAVRAWLQALGMPLRDDRADAVRLLISELVTASVKASGADGRGRIAIALAAEDGVVRVEVTDPKTEATCPDRPDEVTGWGFYLVDKMADRWGVVEDAPRRLWFEIEVYRLAERMPDRAS